MSRVHACPIPPGSLLRAYLHPGAHADCYQSSVKFQVTHSDFVAAFYSTWLFKTERTILRWAVKRPSTDEDALQLALGNRREFAAWRVEAREENQLLLCDFTGRTRSWLMVAGAPGQQAPCTVLYFGSAVVPRVDPATGTGSLGVAFRCLLGFHALYSRLLLRAACARLEASR